METNRVELTLFPEYSTLVSAERNLEEYPLFELKARQRGSKARLFERVIEGDISRLRGSLSSGSSGA